MKAFLLAVAALVLIAVGASFGLNEIGFSAAERTTVGQSVRLGN